MIPNPRASVGNAGPTYSKPAVRRSEAVLPLPESVLLWDCAGLKLGALRMLQSADLAQCAITAGWPAVRNTGLPVARYSPETKSLSAVPMPTP